MAKLGDFSVFDDTTPPRSEASDPSTEGTPASRQVLVQRASVHPSALPSPYETDADGELGRVEREDLTRCEAAIDTLRLAFWAAGRALAVIQSARLYRETHATFEEYVEDRWQMGRAYAYRLIQAYPLAEALSPIGDTTLNESQVRELIPLASQHGDDAAVTVYRTVAETDGVQVTAKVIKKVVAILPPDRFDAAEAVAQIRALLAGELATPAADADSGPTVLAAASNRVRTIAAKVTRLADAHPAQVREFVDELRTLADQMEKHLA